jgi:TRAP-type C4-dicarboxylate transport system permease small subunit
MPDIDRVPRPLRLAAAMAAALLPGSMVATFVAIAWLRGILFGHAIVIREVDIVRRGIVHAACPRAVQRGMEIVSGLVVAGVPLWSLPKARGYVQVMKIGRTAFLRIPFDLVFAICGPFVVPVVLRTLWGVREAATGSGRHAPAAARAGAAVHD